MGHKLGGGGVSGCAIKATRKVGHLCLFPRAVEASERGALVRGWGWVNREERGGGWGQAREFPVCHTTWSHQPGTEEVPLPDPPLGTEATPVTPLSQKWVGQGPEASPHPGMLRCGLSKLQPVSFFTQKGRETEEDTWLWRAHGT